MVKRFSIYYLLLVICLFVWKSFDHTSFACSWCSYVNTEQSWSLYVLSVLSLPKFHILGSQHCFISLDHCWAELFHFGDPRGRSESLWSLYCCGNKQWRRATLLLSSHSGRESLGSSVTTNRQKGFERRSHDCGKTMHPGSGDFRKSKTTGTLGSATQYNWKCG